MDSNSTQVSQGDDQLLYNRISAWEMSLIALCVWREARNQQFEGKLAVAWSIRNRVKAPGKHWWGDTFEEVILKPWQYSSFNADDPNAKLIPGDPAKDRSWDESLTAADRAYLGIGIDPSKGATHYHDSNMVTPPAWTKDPTTKFIVTIGDHRFYKAN